jgi:hypothetical protein
VFQVRVITADLAQQHRDITAIPVHPHGFELNVTLRELRQTIAENVPGCAPPALEIEENECNCSLARALIDTTNVKRGPRTEDDAAPGRLILLLYSKALTKLVKIECQAPELHLSIVKEQLRTQLGDKFLENRHIEIWESHSQAPIVTVCSAMRHQSGEAAPTSSITVQHATQLDLHTAELPISTPRTDLTLDQLGLDDFIVNGVLNLYAVIRKDDASSTIEPIFNGKAEIYRVGRHWVRILREEIP